MYTAVYREREKEREREREREIYIMYVYTYTYIHIYTYIYIYIYICNIYGSWKFWQHTVSCALHWPRLRATMCLLL